MIRRFCASLFVLLTPAAPLLAGSTITTNLPANTVILNIDSQNDGAASFNGDQSLWYHPFSYTNSIPTFTVQPGTYSFRIINPTDAAAIFPSLTTDQQSQIYTAWTYNNPWITNYLIYPATATSDYTTSQLLYGAPSTEGYSNATDAYNGSISNGHYNAFYPGIADGSIPLTTTYTFTSAQTLVAVIPDYGLYDNIGGLSVLIQLSGDANYDGHVGPDDYTLIDRGYAKHLTGWSNGDFNGDGVVDASDYLIIDSAFASHNGGSLSPSLLASREAQFGDTYAAGLLASVPEPSLCFLAPLLLLSRRRRKS